MHIKPKMSSVSFWVIFAVVLLYALQAIGADRGIVVKTILKSGTTKEIKLYSGYHAMVVGCGAYNKGWPSLPNAVGDAREVASALEGLGWDVNLLENPTGRALREGLNKLVTGPGRDRSKGILIWFSGHGHTYQEADGTNLGYLVPIDAPDPEKNEFGFITESISMRQIETVAKQIYAKHVIMLFDSCFSGAIFHMVRAKPSHYIQEKVSEPVRQFITAGDENEKVPDRSVFKEVFIQGVTKGYADRNTDGYVTGEELGAYLTEQVINYSRKAQHPQYGKINNPRLDKGDFVFALRKLSELEQLKRDYAALQTKYNELLSRYEARGETSEKQTAKAPEPFEKQATGLAKTPGQARQPSAASQPNKIAVFPWLLRGEANVFRVELVDGIVQTVQDFNQALGTDTFSIACSFYKTSKLQRIAQIEDGIVDLNSLYSRKGVDTEYAREIGQKLDVDTIVFGEVVSKYKGTFGNTITNFSLYLIDVNTGNKIEEVFWGSETNLKMIIENSLNKGLTRYASNSF